MPPEGCWIKYQLDLRNIKLEIIAKKAGCAISTVSRVICKTRHSEKAEAVLAEMLGYPTFKDLWVDAFINADFNKKERKAV
jgi:lambda repressor-like predicted transcriptional regulator